MEAGPSYPQSSPSSGSVEQDRTRSPEHDNSFQQDQPPTYDETHGRNEADDALLASSGKAYMEDDSHTATPARMSESLEESDREARRLATLEQKKAMWWRNTAVTAMFIASW